MQPGQIDLQFDGYEAYWNSAEKKGYSGTAIFARHKPLSVSYDIGIDQHDHEGRVITLEMSNFFLVCCYTPNSQDELKRLDYRMTWEADFPSGNRPQKPKDQPSQCGFHRRGAPAVQPAARSRIYRHLPLEVS